KIWELVLDAFESANPSKHPIFEFCSNLNSEGIDKLFIAYDIGIERLQTIVNQEILLTEKHTTVRRKARNIVRFTVANINKMRKGKEGKRGEDREIGRPKDRPRGKPRGRPKGKPRERRQRDINEEKANENY
ncbi:6007_t:CDS:1, partial [Rhizophagus irregularis]